MATILAPPGVSPERRANSGTSGVLPSRSATLAQSPPEGERFTLRDYQRDALAAIDEARARRVFRQLAALPTGAGKTIIFAHLIAQQAGRVLVLVHRDELIQQGEAKIRFVAPHLRLGIVKAKRDEVDAQVVIASVQTLARPERLRHIGRDFTLVIVDEAHHAAAKSYRTILEHVRCFEPNGPLLLGVTATPDRSDGQGLGGIFSEVVYERDLLSMIEAGYLADVRAVQVQVAADFGSLRVRAGDFIESEAAALLTAANTPAHVLRAVQRHAADRHAILIFAPSVALSQEMAATFAAAGIPAAHLDGTTPQEERRAILARFHAGELRVLSNCGVLLEGWDEPRVDAVVMARPTRSRALFMQALGRGTRLYPGKPDLLMLDVVGEAHRHDLQTTASLFGVEPAALTSRTVTRLLADREAEQPTHDVVAATSGRLVAKPIELFASRRTTWADAGGGRFALPTGHGQLVLIERSDGWSVAQLERGEPARILRSGLPIDWAQGYAEDLARKLGAGALLDPAAPWRAKPATGKQRAALWRWHVPIPPDLTAGEAADLIGAHLATKGVA